MFLFEDSAGGLAIQSGNTNVFFEGQIPMRVTDIVAPHGDDDPHDKPNPMITGSSSVFINGQALCTGPNEAHTLAGHKAKCLHTVEEILSPRTVFADRGIVP